MKKIKAIRLLPLKDEREPKEPDTIDWRIKGEYHRVNFHLDGKEKKEKKEKKKDE